MDGSSRVICKMMLLKSNIPRKENRLCERIISFVGFWSERIANEDRDVSSSIEL